MDQYTEHPSWTCLVIGLSVIIFVLVSSGVIASKVHVMDPNECTEYQIEQEEAVFTPADPNMILTFSIETLPLPTITFMATPDPNFWLMDDSLSEFTQEYYNIVINLENGCEIMIILTDDKVDVVGDPNCYTEAARMFFNSVN